VIDESERIMNAKLIFAVFAGLACSPALVAGFGRVSIYSDEALSECTLSDTSPRVATIYVSESSSLGATGLRFRIAESAGFTGVWLGETTPYSAVGNSRTDLSLGFGTCMLGHFPVLTVDYQLFGTSTCSDLAIVAAVGFQVPICTGCTADEQLCTGYDPLHVNCIGPFTCAQLATESTTWGKVKSLYRD
jgi:hypothetical protein